MNAHRLIMPLLGATLLSGPAVAAAPAFAQDDAGARQESQELEALRAEMAALQAQLEALSRSLESQGATAPRAPVAPIPPLPPSPALAPLPPEAPLPPDASEEAMRARIEAEIRRELAARVSEESARAFERQMRGEVERETARELRRVNDEVIEREVARELERAGLEDLVQFGSPVHVRPGEHYNDVVAFGGPVTVEGHVHKDVTSFGGPVNILPGGVVDGDAISFGATVNVSDGAELHGGRVNMAGSKAFNPPTSHHAERHSGRGFFANLYRKLIFLLSFAGAGVLVVGLFPARVARVAADITDRPLRAASIGLVFTAVLAIASTLFAVTLIGIPVSLLLFALLGLAWLLGFVGLCQAVGDRLPFEHKPHGRWVAFLFGVVLVSFLGALPFVGWLVVFFVSLLGIGAAFTTRFGTT